MGRYGSEGDYKRRKNFYASLTRRDFKSTGNVGGSASGPGLSLLTQSKPPPRAEKPASAEYGSRPRFRDSQSTGSAPTTSRNNSYSKDSRYGYGSKPYSSYSAGYYHDRNGERGSDRSGERPERREERPGDRISSNAYGSFGGTKRDADYSGSRDSTSRDMVNGISLRGDGPQLSRDSRDSWRGERPKLASSSSSKLFSSGRFNPNSIPISLRSGLNGLVSSVSGDHKKDRYDSYNDDMYGNRWKSSYSSPRSEKGSRPPRLSQPGGRTHPTKERIRSSGLTNSVGTPRRGESYYPSKQFSSGRYTDRYAGGKDYESPSERNEYRENYGNRSVSPSTDNYKFADTSRDDQDGALGDGYDEESYERTLNQNVYDDVNEDLEDEDIEDEEDEDEGNDNAPRDEEEEDDEEGEENGEMEAVKKNDEGIPSKETTNEEAEAVKKLAADTSDNAQSIKVTEPKIAHSEDLKVSLPIVLDGPDDYPDGCNFPLGQIESQFVEINEEFEKSDFNDGSMKFSLTKPVSSLSDYSFFESNLFHFSKAFPSYLRILQNKNQSIKKKKLSLWVQYDTIRKENDHRKAFLEEQLKVLHPPDDETRKELESIDIRVKASEPSSDQQFTNLDSPAQSGRRGRRHGDLVTTEAEFQEILKSLENEQNEGPMVRAERVSAKIPDQIIDPLEKETLKFMDSNNIVHDKDAWTARIKTDFMDTFTEREHDLFCEAFCRFPKRFGQISRFMGGVRDAEECVVHYYMTKKAVNYKFMVSQFKKKTSKKTTRRKPKAKTTLPESTTSEALPAVDLIESLEPSAPKEHTSFETAEGNSNISGKRNVESLDAPAEITTQDDTHPRKKAKTKKEEETLAVPIVPTEAEPAIEHESNKEEQVAPVQGAADEPKAVAPTVQPDDVAATGQVEEKKKHISSYWSITEVNEFPILLKIYGSRWSSIADKLATKTATMVRNYYQRNGGKHGWGEIVQSADYRLAQDSNSAEDGKFSNVDTTIVVKPQKTSFVDAPKTEIHVYDTIDEGRSQEPNHVHATHGAPVPSIQQVSAPMGTFHHSAPYFPGRLPGLLHNPAEIGVKRLNVNELLSSAPSYPPIDSSSYGNHATQRGPILPSVAPAIERSVPPAVAGPIKSEGQKPSITSLLNSDNTTVKPEPVPIAPSRPSNLASLLNSQAAPATTLAPEPQPKERKSSIKSLLAD